MGTSQNEERNKEIIRHSFEQIWSNANLGFVDDLFAAKFVLHQTLQPGEIHGSEGFKSYIEQLRTAFPNRELDAAEYIAEDDTVAVRYTWHGTYEGNLWGIEPTGQSVEGTGMAFVRFEGTKCREAWFVDDFLGLLAQLGVNPPLGEEWSSEQQPGMFDTE